MSKSKCLNAKTNPFCPLDFGIWNLADEIATPRQVGARNDKRRRAQNGTTFLSLRGVRFLAYARNRLRNLMVGQEVATHLSGARNDKK
jgi:hypothetical protein